MNYTSPPTKARSVTKPRDIDSTVLLSADTRDALRTLGNLALKLANGESFDSDWVSGQIDRIAQVEHSTTTDLLTVPEAHARLRISKSGLYNLIHQRAIATVKIGTRTLVPGAEIERLIQQLSVSGGRL
jgi:excisionase family DNA binding protein